MRTWKNVACALFAVVAVATLAAGCSAPVGASAIPRDARETCATQCTNIGMPLDSVVIMAGAVGCVCRPAGSPGAPNAAAGAAGGMAVIMQHNSSQQQQSTQSGH